MNRKREFFVPPVILDRGSKVPLHRQIRSEIARSLESREVTGGMLLPSTRVMARLLGVSRNTMLAVYDDLSADGLITAERGGGMRVNKAGKAGGLMAGLHHVIQAARYPARVVSREDPDENSLYIRF